MIGRHLDFMGRNYSVVPAPDILSLYPAQLPQKDAQAPPDGIFDEGTFFPALEADINRAEASVEIYSAFMTLQRTAKFEFVFRNAIARGVTIRCITRPPKNGGMPAVAQTDKALDTLEAWGVLVDLRHAIHQKAILIDDEIAYFGSLNPLSATSATRETMLRLASLRSVTQLREALAIPGLRSNSDKASTCCENPPCPECKERTVFHAAGYSFTKNKAYESFWRCDTCSWSMSHRAFLRQNKRHDTTDKGGSSEAKQTYTR